MGSINKEKVATQEAETGIMKLLVERVSAKVRSNVFPSHKNLPCIGVVKNEHDYPIYMLLNRTHPVKFKRGTVFR